MLVALRILRLASDAVSAFVAGLDQVLLTSAVLTFAGGVLAAVFLPGKPSLGTAAEGSDGAQSPHELAGTA